MAVAKVKESRTMFPGREEHERSSVPARGTIGQRTV